MLYAGSPRGPRRGLAMLLMGGTMLAAGCDSITEPGALSTPPTEAVTTVASAQADFQAVTRALAVAMQDRSVRVAVRDAMRDSPWNEHKVVLQELLAAPEGAGVLAAAAAAAGRTPAEFTQMLAGMPALDFYAPSRDVRRTWQGTPNVAVTGSQNPEAGGFVTFGGDGQQVAQAARGDAVLMLHPAEPKLARSRPQPRGNGEVIQMPGDGEKAATVTWFYPGGDSVVVQIEDVVSGKDPRFTVVGNTGPRTYGTVTPTPANPSPSTYAYLDYFDLNFGDGGGNVELRIEARFYGPAGDYYGMARYSDNEVPDGAQQSPGVPLIAHIPPVETDARIYINVWEDDCGCWGNDDDHYGGRDYKWFDRDQTRSIYKGSSHTLDLELNWVARAKSALARYTLPDVWVETGYSTQVSVAALDQYGYRLINQQHTVTSWYTDNTWIASASSAGGAYGDVYGNAPGTTRLNAVVNGTTTVSSNVTVQEPWYPPCDPSRPFEVC